MSIYITVMVKFYKNFKNMFQKFLKRDNIKFIIMFVVGLTLAYLTREVQVSHRNIDMYAQLNESLTDSLQHTKDALGRSVYRISTLEVLNEKAFKDLNIKDSTIQKLQKMVDQYSKQATLIQNQTYVYGTGKYSQFLKKRFYHFDFDGWVKADLKLMPDKDDMTLGVEVINELMVIHKVDPENGKMYVEVSDSNPYTKTKSLRSYYRTNDLKEQNQKSETNSKGVVESILTAPLDVTQSILSGGSNNRKCKVKRWSIGPYIGYGFGYDKDSKKVFASPSVGVGIQYGIIRF